MSEERWEPQAVHVAYDETTLLAESKHSVIRATKTLIKKRKAFRVDPCDDGWLIVVDEENEPKGMAGRWME